MRRHFLTATAKLLSIALIAPAPLIAHSAVARAGHLLEPRLQPGDEAEVEITLEMGGKLIVADAQGKEVRLPVSAVGKLEFHQQLLSWDLAATNSVRDVRRYHSAAATLKSDAAGAERKLDSNSTTVVAAILDGRLMANGLDAPLTREQADLIDTMADPLTLDRLLPNREVEKGEKWSHDKEAIASLLGMDHVAACTAESEITGVSNGQVQIRMAGTADGVIDGAATELELQAAYLYHPGEGRITKFNLAVREERKPGEASPGLDATAKLSIHVQPSTRGASSESEFSVEDLNRAASFSEAEVRQLAIDAPQRGFRFRHDNAWIVTAEPRDLLSLRLLKGGEMIAHCNVSALPSGSADQSTTLADFERDVRHSLGEKAEQVAAAKEWTTSAGHRCFGVFVDGKVDDAAIQWRYYLVSDDSLGATSVSVTVEQTWLADFADADRLIVDSLELLPRAATPAEPASTASSKPSGRRAGKTRR
ncbi:MAG: hypothetical protein KDA61_15845 [Planctomycetales bacterium]|nr:hypothetical protein [Planctomycetales bacterium]